MTGADAVQPSQETIDDLTEYQIEKEKLEDQGHYLAHKVENDSYNIHATVRNQYLVSSVCMLATGLGLGFFASDNEVLQKIGGFLVPIGIVSNAVYYMFKGDRLNTLVDRFESDVEEKSGIAHKLHALKEKYAGKLKK